MHVRNQHSDGKLAEPFRRCEAKLRSERLGTQDVRFDYGFQLSLYNPLVVFLLRTHWV